MKPETETWVKKAREHLELAGAVLRMEYFAQSVFFCQQSIEMMLKALWIEQATEGLPRRTHDLVSLAEELRLEISEEWLGFLRQLAEQYIPTRYVDVPPVEYPRESAENYYDRTREIFSWLQQLLN